MKHTNHHQAPDFSHYDTYSTKALDALLNLDLDKPGHWLSTDEMLYISELLVQRNETEQWFDFPDTAKSWKNFLRRKAPFRERAIMNTNRGLSEI